MSSLDVLLVSMPFAPVTLPHAAVGVLCGATKRAGLSVRATYPSFRLADRLGFALYTSFAENYIFRQLAYQDFPGERLFASWMDPCRPSVLADRQEALVLGPEIARLFPGESLETVNHRLRRVQTVARDFLLAEVDSALRLKPAIVGCSSTFIQHTASLTFLRAIKEREPLTVTVLGGANCEGEMGFETALQFPWVDYVFSGEADESFPALCRRLLENKTVPISDLPYGVYSREKATLQDSATRLPPQYEVATVENLEKAGPADYEDYFQERDQSCVRDWVKICSVEAARGCQKGERSICAFCALNGERVGYRSKNNDDFWKEIADLSERYKAEIFILTDNILGVEAFDGWLKRAAETRHAAFVLEVRSTLDEEQVRALAAAQVCQVQPGIESLDDHLLRLMSKGNSVVRNVAFLKYLREQSIGAWWNLLYQIPGEENEDYLRQAELFPLLHHLPPPLNITRIRFSKFSRYERRPEEFGLELRPSEAFRALYPRVSDASLWRLAHCYVDNRLITVDYQSGNKRLMFERASEWRALYSSTGTDGDCTPPVLSMRDLNGLIKIRDTRSCAVHPYYLLDELESAVYRETRAPKSISKIREALSLNTALGSRTGRVEECLEMFLRYKLMIRRGSLYLGLAAYPPAPISSIRRRGLEYVRQTAEALTGDFFHEDVNRLFASNNDNQRA